MVATRRLFFALWPAPAARTQLEALSRMGPAGWRPVPAADLHLTVLFLGAVAEARLEPLCRAVDRLRKPAFDQVVTRLESWAGGTLYCCAGDAHATLKVLHRELAAAARGIGLEVEHRAYRPHITLARVGRNGPGWRAGPLDEPVHLVAQALVLAQSIGRQAEGPRYRPLRAWAFGADAARRFRKNR